MFHIVNMEDGLSATLDSPDQGAKGVPVTSVSRTGSSLQIEMKALAAIFKGQIAPDLASIKGSLTQMGKDMPLLLTKDK